MSDTDTMQLLADIIQSLNEFFAGMSPRTIAVADDHGNVFTLEAENSPVDPLADKMLREPIERLLGAIRQDLCMSGLPQEIRDAAEAGDPLAQLTIAAMAGDPVAQLVMSLVIASESEAGEGEF